MPLPVVTWRYIVSALPVRLRVTVNAGVPVAVSWRLLTRPEIVTEGETEEEAVANLKEALKLYLEPPNATRTPKIRTIEVEIGAA